MEVLAVRPHSAPELAASLGVHVRTARRILKRLESEGYLSPGT
jgi:predicted ArsR family transcriptional regulator